jgi:hypothetical protein
VFIPNGTAPIPFRPDPRENNRVQHILFSSFPLLTGTSTTPPGPDSSPYFLESKSKLEHRLTTSIEDLEAIKDCLTGYMREVSNSLLKCTKPNTSKREKSDLTIWREIFTCQTRECSCLNLDFRTIQTKYISFYSDLGAKNYVCSTSLSSNYR